MAELRRLEDVTTADLAPLERALDPEYPWRLREIATVLYLALQDYGPALHEMPMEQASIILTEALSLGIGGGSGYIPKGFLFRQRLGERDRKIAQQYNGHNAHLLARQYKRSDMRIKQIVAAWQEEHFLALQDQLPGMPDRAPAGRPKG